MFDGFRQLGTLPIPPLACLTTRANWFLVKAARRASTAKRYLTELRKFLEWCDESAAPACRTADDLDELVCEYFHWLYCNGGSKSAAQKCKSALAAAIPSLQGQLRLAGLALKGWENTHPSVAYPPMTWPFLGRYCVVGLCC